MNVVEATLQKSRAIWIASYQRARGGRSSALPQPRNGTRTLDYVSALSASVHKAPEVQKGCIAVVEPPGMFYNPSLSFLLAQRTMESVK